MNDNPTASKPSPSDELVDVLDDAGRVVGTATRREMRARRLPHRATYLLVFNDRDELFVHLRTATKDVYPSHWDVSIGGVVATGESFDDAARREAAEEIGVDLAPERLFPFQFSDDASIVHGMVYRAMHNGPFRLQPEEVVRGDFLPLVEVAARIARGQFCPDGVAVLREFEHRTASGEFPTRP